MLALISIYVMCVLLTFIMKISFFLLTRASMRKVLNVHPDFRDPAQVSYALNWVDEKLSFRRLSLAWLASMLLPWRGVAALGAFARGYVKGRWRI